MTLAGGAGDQVAGGAGEGKEDGGGRGRGGRKGEKVGIIHLQTHQYVQQIEAQYKYPANHIESKEKECALHLQLLADFSSGQSGAHATRELSS